MPKKTRDFSSVDNAIVEAVRGGHKRAGDILSAVKDVASKLEPKREYRLVDRRLQAMRKAKKIQYVTGTGWLVSAAQ